MKLFSPLFATPRFTPGFVCLVAGMVLLLAGGAQAATISWGAGIAITGDTDVSLNRTNQWAYSMGAGDVAINGVTFAAETAAAGNANFTTTLTSTHATVFSGDGASFTDLSANYKTVLKSAAYANASSLTITLNNLSVGLTYEVQVWVNDARAGYPDRNATVAGVTLEYSVIDGGAGSYAIGTFVADAATQSFVLDANDSRGAMLNAIQLRANTDPPPPLGYALTLQPPNGFRIPKVIGASGSIMSTTGYDYLKWFGTTEHRYWFKPAFSTLADDRAITTPAAFAAASEAIRQDPMRQGTASDTFIDWEQFYGELASEEVTEELTYLAERGIMPLISNSMSISPDSITDDWVTIFKYWKHWYRCVYYLASQHDVTMYAFRNEPHAKEDYESWESQWLVGADAMRKAMDDVNEDFGKSLELKIAGPTCAGAYFNYEHPDPYDDAHGWGSVSWKKVKYDIYGNYDVNNPWNYGAYDYHRYGQNAVDTEWIMKNLRSEIANAQNDPNSEIPLLITEYNTSTGGNFRNRDLDTEDLHFGINMAQIMEVSGAYGPDGLGDEGGFFIFKLGAAQGTGDDMFGVGNKLTYSSTQSNPGNYGGVTRGGACFQMYARHFSGGKPLVPVVATSFASEYRRTLAVIDEEKGMYYIYGSNVEGTDLPVSIDMSAMDVESGTVASLQRVDEKNTGQITELLALDDSKKLYFYCPDHTAFLVKVPMTGTVPYQWEITPSDDTTQQVVDSGAQGALSTMKVSNHHSDTAQRNVGLLRFSVEGAGNLGQALLKISGKNTGTDQTEREIVHVYAVTGEDWSEDVSRAFSDAPGLGQYTIDGNTIGTTDGTGDMVDIEDNYSGLTSGAGTGLGLAGEFLGAVSFYSSEYTENYLDVTDYLNSIEHDGLTPLDVTFVVVRIVRYNVNDLSNATYYNLGDYHYDGRVVEIASKEHADEDLQPRLLCTTGLPPFIDADDFVNSSGVSVEPSSDVGGGNMVEFSAIGHSVSYEVRVAAAGSYLVSFRVASDAGSVNLELAQDGVPVTTLNRVIEAGETWATVYKMVPLQAGFTTFTVTATGGDVQFLNWFELSTSNGLFEESIPPAEDPINLALNQPASASNVHSSPYSAAKAVDGSLATRWATSVLTPWMEVDLGEAVWVNGSMIVEDRNRIRSYEIQVYNGTWETVFVGGNPTSGQTEEFTPVMGSKVRLQITAATDNPTLEEWELYGTDPIDQSSTMAVNAASVSFEWPNVPGATYAVQSSTNLVTDAFATTIESGIPALTETNSITVEMPVDPAAFFRVIVE